MDHREYIERYIVSDRGTELDLEERAAISEHLAGCPECREKLESERATKSILQKKVPIVAAPPALRMRILATLDASDARERSSRVATSGRRFWLTAGAMAAAAILIVAILQQRQRPVAAFDKAIAAYEQSEQNFTPAVGTESEDRLAVALINEFGVAPVWDFSSVGLSPAGGRIDHSADGKAIAYGRYNGQHGSLLCIIDRDDTFHFPPGGQVIKGVHIYRYRGFSIAATNRYAVFCIMVTRLPVVDLAHAFDQLPT